MLPILQKKILEPFKPISFDENRHIYFWYGQKVKKSVSAKVDEFVEKFDPNKVLSNGMTLIQASAVKQSRLQGKVITEHELMHSWQTMAKTGCELGTETHDYMEYYNGIKIPDTPQKVAGVKFLTWLFSQTFVNKEGKLERRYEIVAKELRMYSVRFKFAGTADLIVADKMLRTIVIFDYKTNKDLFKTFGYLKHPFDFLEMHPYNKYQLQLSYYHIIFEEMTGIKISDRVLVYLKADSSYINYSLQDFTKDLIEVEFKKLVYN